MKPILDGTPLPRSIYVLGKLGGAWLAIGIVLLYSLACVMLGTINIRAIDLNAGELLNPGRPYLYRYFWLGWIDRAFNTPLGAHVIGVSVGIGLLELLRCGLLVWLRLREGRGVHAIASRVRRLAVRAPCAASLRARPKNGGVLARFATSLHFVQGSTRVLREEPPPLTLLRAHRSRVILTRRT